MTTTSSSSSDQPSCSSPRAGLYRALKDIRSRVSSSTHTASPRLSADPASPSSTEAAMETSAASDSCPALSPLCSSSAPDRSLSPWRMNDMQPSPCGVCSTAAEHPSCGLPTLHATCGLPASCSPPEHRFAPPAVPAADRPHSGRLVDIGCDPTSAEFPCEQAPHPPDDAPRSLCTANMWKHVHLIADAAAVMLVTLLLSSLDIIKRLYISVLSEGIPCPNAGYVRTPSASHVDDGEHDMRRTDHQEPNVDSVLQSPEISRARRQSKRLKSKLRSSFKSLSLQIPRKAFTPLQLNKLSPSSPSSSSSSASSPYSAHSSATKKAWTPKGSGFACRIVKSFNHRSSHCSPTPGASPLSECKPRLQVPEKSVTTTYSNRTTVATLVSFPLAFCGLVFGKLIAGAMVTTWLLMLSIVNTF